jgi:hypothetical protein
MIPYKDDFSHLLDRHHAHVSIYVRLNLNFSLKFNNKFNPNFIVFVVAYVYLYFRGGSRIFRTSVKIFWQTGRYRRWAWSRLGVVDYRRGGGSGR